jgi:hypothetical protein
MTWKEAAALGGGALLLAMPIYWITAVVVAPIIDVQSALATIGEIPERDRPVSLSGNPGRPADGAADDQAGGSGEAVSRPTSGGRRDGGERPAPSHVETRMLEWWLARKPPEARQPRKRHAAGSQAAAEAQTARLNKAQLIYRMTSGMPFPIPPDRGGE